MRGIAFKIFLSFWLIFAVLIASFAILPNRGATFRFTDRVRQDGVIASALFEREGVQSCAAFSAAVEQQTHVRFALLDGHRTPVCRSASADVADFEPYFDSGSDNVVTATASGPIAIIHVQSPSGAPFLAAGAAVAGFDESPIRLPFPSQAVGLAIFVSGLVCFAVARYLARPLQRVRDASHRLAAGDLEARAGPGVRQRRDEIGELVRDFDAMAARIESLVHSQTQLLSDISHELRSPLARLNVALELARRKSGPEARVDLDHIEAEADRMNDLIGRILALVRAERNRAADTMIPVDLVEVLTSVANDADYEAHQQHKSVTLRVAASPTLSRGDPQLIASAVDNIVRNGVRYTPEHSSVDIALEGDDREARIRIRDHGPGVPPQELERIFMPFHRVEPARHAQTDGAGVGLGLSIARRAIAVHGGTVTADNAADGGLEVTLRIPL